MPTHGSHSYAHARGVHLPKPRCALAVAFGVLIFCGQTLSEPVHVRSRHVALYYHFQGASASAQMELWHTRDRGATWHKYGEDPDRQSPIVFEAPAEGLYGFILIARDGHRASAPEPRPHDPAQRWVFVDYTPPLLQWHAVEPGEDFANRRMIQLRWTAYDDHLVSRPICLAYQNSIDQQWNTIATDVSNTGRYDWAVPYLLTCQITLKISARDQGGHITERLYGPLRLTDWLQSTTKTIATQPADRPPTAATATLPATGETKQAAPASQPSVDVVSRNMAEQRYKQGAWHLLRGQYALAAERFREVLDLDPTLVPAINDLAGIHYLKEDYPRAVELYQKALTWDSNDRQALRGAALAYVARRDYAKSQEMLNRLLGLNNQDAEALLDLGDVLFMMGDRSGAHRKWTRAMEVNASAVDVVRKARQRLHLYEAPPEEEDSPMASSESDRTR